MLERWRSRYLTRALSLRGCAKSLAQRRSKPSSTEIMKKYIDYNRQDVLATWEVAEALLKEYERHPIILPPTEAYSPASIGKAYLRGMGIKPILVRQPDFLPEYLGYAQTAFFGGRTSAHIRRTSVPVLYTDFLSMYPTVNSLMKLWRFVTSREVNIIEHCQSEIQTFLEKISVEELFRSETWQQLPAFVKLMPDGDILPSRAIQRGKQRLAGCRKLPLRRTWKSAARTLVFPLPDVVASRILTGRVPDTRCLSEDRAGWDDGYT